MDLAKVDVAVLSSGQSMFYHCLNFYENPGLDVELLMSTLIHCT